MQEQRRYWVTLFGLVSSAALIAGACGGKPFSAGEPSENAFGGSAGTAGSGQGGVPAACSGPDECDDGDACTIDTCERGACKHEPVECAPGLRCCDGTCGECCSDDDCGDEVACTDDVCFLNSCAHLPDDDHCEEGKYCDARKGCAERRACPGGLDAECDDEDPCTTDRCEGGLCYHEGCGEGLFCCPGEGCFACCGDTHCQNQDADRCTDNVCVEHACQTLPHCESGQCCASASGVSCGECCSAEDCDDGVECTLDSCSSDGCKHVPDDALCESGHACNPELGCVPTSNCDSCAKDQVCCDGQCQECCTPTDCQKFLGAQAIPPPDGECAVAHCVQGTCSFASEVCGLNEVCCEPLGCRAFGCPF